MGEEQSHYRTGNSQMGYMGGIKTSHFQRNQTWTREIIKQVLLSQLIIFHKLKSINNKGYKIPMAYCKAPKKDLCNTVIMKSKEEVFLFDGYLLLHIITKLSFRYYK